MQLRILVSFLLLTFFSCSTKKSPNVLSMDKMVDIITDIQLADAAYKLQMLPDEYKSNPEKYYLEILSANQTDSAAYNKSMLYYSENPTLLKQIYLRVEKNIQQSSEPPKSK